jgi:exodeoxyribonuclease V alpha subunit
MSSQRSSILNTLGLNQMSYRGRVNKVYFSDPSTDFYIFLADDLNKSGKTKVKGNIFSPRIFAGVEFEVTEFEWEKSPQYGSTMVAKRVRPILDTSESREHCLKGACASLGALNASKLVDYLYKQKVDFLDAMDGPKSPFDGITTMDEAAARLAWVEWRRFRSYSRAAYELTSLGLPSSKIKEIYETLGPDTVDKIAANPYSLALTDGVGFPLADNIALKQGFDTDSQDRIASILEYLLEKAASMQGHLYVERGKLARVLRDLPRRENVPGYGRSLTNHDIDMALEDRETKGRVVLEGDKVYLSHNHELEVNCVKLFRGLQGSSNLNIDVDVFLKEYERIYGISFSAQQSAAVHALNVTKTLLLTGLPGTGKSTVTKALVRLFQKAKISFTLMAPTGIAAKRLSTVVGESAGTIHRTLGYSPDGSWEYNSYNLFVTDAVVIDEASMIDQNLLYHLLSSLKPETIVVFVGDHAQLPSVGAGNVLHDMISSGVITRVHLTEIFRQNHASDIVLNAHRINAGEDLVLGDPTDKNTDFRFVQMDSPQEIVHGMLHVVNALRKASEKSDLTFQVLSPTYKGDLGVDRLNRDIKELLNPMMSQHELQVGRTSYREDDRLMVVKNHYSLEVFNGEVGKLYRIDQKGKKMYLKIFDEPSDRILEVPFSDIKSLTKLAYAVTIHKIQGQEFDYIVMPFHESFSVQLQRNLLYTAITRAKKKVFVFGQYKALRKAIRNDSVTQRNTDFARRLSEALGD